MGNDKKDMTTQTSQALRKTCEVLPAKFGVGGCLAVVCFVGIIINSML